MPGRRTAPRSSASTRTKDIVSIFSGFLTFCKIAAFHSHRRRLQLDGTSLMGIMENAVVSTHFRCGTVDELLHVNFARRKRSWEFSFQGFYKTATNLIRYFESYLTQMAVANGRFVLTTISSKGCIYSVVAQLSNLDKTEKARWQQPL